MILKSVQANTDVFHVRVAMNSCFKEVCATPKLSFENYLMFYKIGYLEFSNLTTLM